MTIKVNGKPYEVYKDNDGIFRFKENNLLRKIIISQDIKITEIIKLYELDAITLMELLDYYTGLGYTVGGVEELSFFQDLEFIKYK